MWVQTSQRYIDVNTIPKLKFTTESTRMLRAPSFTCPPTAKGMSVRWHVELEDRGTEGTTLSQKALNNG